MNKNFSKVLLGIVSASVLLISGTPAMAAGTAQIPSQIEILGGDLTIETLGDVSYVNDIFTLDKLEEGTATEFLLPDFKVTDTRGTLDGYKVQLSVSPLTNKDNPESIINRSYMKLKSDQLAGTDNSGAAISDSVLVGKSATPATFTDGQAIVSFGANQGMGVNNFTNLGLLLELDQTALGGLEKGVYQNIAQLNVYVGP